MITKVKPVTKQYASEAELTVRVLSSGVKFTDATLKQLGVDKDGSIGHAIDGKKVYIHAQGGEIKLADKKTTNSQLATDLVALAKGKQVIGKDGKPTGKTIGTNVKKQSVAVVLNVSETPTVEEGVTYYEVTFAEAKAIVLRTKKVAAPASTETEPLAAAVPAGEAEDEDSF